jgi:hypothetical protein
MSDQRDWGELTPAARAVLDEVVQGIREEVLRIAAEQSTQRSPIDSEISAGDILNAVEAVRLGQRGRRPVFLASLDRARLVRPISSLVAMVFFFFVGIGINVITTNQGEELVRNAGQWIKHLVSSPWFTAVLGASAALLGYMWAHRLRIRESLTVGSRTSTAGTLDKTSGPLGIIMLWRDLELLARKALASQLGESHADEPLTKVVKTLASAHILDENEEADLLDILNLRNDIVHEGRTPSSEEYRLTYKKSVPIVRKLQHAIERSSL